MNDITVLPPQTKKITPVIQHITTLKESSMTDKSLENKFSISVPTFTKASIDARFFLELRGPGNVVVGKIIVDKGGVIFEGDADASAKVFIDELVKQWSPQWWQAQERIASLESRTVTVKLPPRVDSSNVPFTAHAWNCCLDAVEKCLTAAGIQVIEGEG